MNKCVLITGIGGNVGQGILRNIDALNYHIRKIGTNTEAVTAGNHLCDTVYKVPYGYDKGYIAKIKRICQKEKVNLIIPSTGYEAYYLSVAREQLPPVATSHQRVNAIFLDKYLTSTEFTKYKIAFAKTTLPSKYNGQFEEIIVKPREGRGSRDLHFNPPRPQDFSDNFIVQKLYRGAEITSAFYVTRQKKVLGPITFVRELSHGTTIKCSVTFSYDRLLKEIITRMVEHFAIFGSCNLQAIATSRQKVVPFEVNCRISGTNSIRSQFGFNDVDFTLREYLFCQKLISQPQIKKGAAVRILMDVIYPAVTARQIKDKHTEHYLF